MNGPLMLPGDKITFEAFNIGVKREDFRLKSKYVLARGGDPSYVQAWVTGCVAYLDEFKGVHATLYNFQYTPTRTFLRLDGGGFPGVLQMSSTGNGAY